MYDSNIWRFVTKAWHKEACIMKLVERTSPDGLYRATVVSGKGVGSIPGLTKVFYQVEVTAHQQPLPRYLEQACYEQIGDVPFTMSSNTVWGKPPGACADRESDFQG
jgi:hypothetical protein